MYFFTSEVKNNNCYNVNTDTGIMLTFWIGHAQLVKSV